MRVCTYNITTEPKGALGFLFFQARKIIAQDLHDRGRERLGEEGEEGQEEGGQESEETPEEVEDRQKDTGAPEDS